MYIHVPEKSEKILVLLIQIKYNVFCFLLICVKLSTFEFICQCMLCVDMMGAASIPRNTHPPGVPDLTYTIIMEDLCHSIYSFLFCFAVQMLDFCLVIL